MAKILVVDDDPGMREMLQSLLMEEGYDVTSIGDPVVALDLCREKPFDVVITDLKMPKIDGIELLKSIKNQRPETIVILMTAYASGEPASNAMKEGAYDYIEKGNIHDEIRTVVHTALMSKGLISDDPAGEKSNSIYEDKGL